MDLLHVKSEVNLIKEKCTTFHSNINVEHQKLYKQAVEMAASVGETPSMPRIVTQQIHRANSPASTPEVYYCINVTENFLAHLIASLEDKFGNYSMVIYEGFCIVPSVMLKLVKAKKPWENELQRFVDFYKNDLSNIEGLGAELEMWEARWLRESSLDDFTIPDMISETLLVFDKDFYPNIDVILNILAVVPAPTCSCERSISVLRRLKTWLRSSITRPSVKASWSSNLRN